MLQVEQIEKRFGKLQVLKGISFELNEPGIFAILGPNGSGKTTLLKSILGMVITDSGKIFIDSNSVIAEWKYRDKIAYLPQIARFPENLSVSELIQMIADIRNKQGRETELIERFRLGEMMQKKLSELSGGTKQKVNIVLAFMFDYEICILDEPTAGLDPLSLIELKQLLKEEKEKGKIIIITTHIMSLVEELAEEIIFLLEGKIHFKGSIKRLKEKSGMENLEHAIASLLTK